MEGTTPASKRTKKSAPQWSWHRSRVARLLLMVVALVIVIDALVGDRGLLAMIQARREYDTAAASLARQRAVNSQLREEARRLREDPAAIEEVARGELRLIKPGEKVFIIKDVPPPEQ